MHLDKEVVEVHSNTGLTIYKIISSGLYEIDKCVFKTLSEARIHGDNLYRSWR